MLKFGLLIIYKIVNFHVKIVSFTIRGAKILSIYISAKFIIVCNVYLFNKAVFFVETLKF